MNYRDDNDLWLQIAQNMRDFGGSFAYCIGAAMIHADGTNRERLEREFRDLMDKYHPSNWQ